MDQFPPTDSFPSDQAYQDYILQGVSRTFALTIPQLPADLHQVVGNAYLLCRIADTIEDETALTPSQKRYFSQEFADVVSGSYSAPEFARELFPLLSDGVLDAERDLIRNAPRVLRLTRGFPEVQRLALHRCVRIMADGMAEFQEHKPRHGLMSLSHLDRYCYYVAGVVGEMLTELFCHYCEPVRTRKDTLLKLAVSFGQGLQMTNILKDIWEDRRRGVCWLPRDVFLRAGFDLDHFAPGNFNAAFGEGLMELVAIAHSHLRNALEYTLLFPGQEKGIRRFCLWALGMAVLTLRKIHGHPDFTAGAQVKISRRSVKATVAVTSMAVGNDRVLRELFAFYTRSLPAPADLGNFVSVT